MHVHKLSENRTNTSIPREKTHGPSRAGLNAAYADRLYSANTPEATGTTVVLEGQSGASTSFRQASAVAWQD